MAELVAVEQEWVNGQHGAHALMVPPWEESDLCAPTWARRRRGRFRDPVTLVMVLEAEAAQHHGAILAEHLHCLMGFTSGAELLREVTAAEEPGRVVTGLNLLLFAAELASALRSQFAGSLDPSLRTSGLEAVNAATLTAAGLLSGSMLALQRLVDPAE